MKHHVLLLEPQSWDRWSWSDGTIYFGQLREKMTNQSRPMGSRGKPVDPSNHLSYPGHDCLLAQIDKTNKLGW